MDRPSTTPMNIVEEDAGTTIKERISRTQVVDVVDVVEIKTPMFLQRSKPILGLLNLELLSKLNILQDLGMWYR